MLGQQALSAVVAHNMPFSVQLLHSLSKCFWASSPNNMICFAGADSPVGLFLHWTALHLLSILECPALDPCHHRPCLLEPYRGCLPLPPVLNHQSCLLCSPSLQILQPDSHWWCTAGCSQGAQCLICTSVDMSTLYTGTQLVCQPSLHTFEYVSLMWTSLIADAGLHMLTPTGGAHETLFAMCSAADSEI